MSRSGTMGVRRPPTRRHTPAPPVVSSSSPEPEDDVVNVSSRDEVTEDSDDNLLSSPDYAISSSKSRLNETGALSIVGFKNISPKIRVGFPVEIQLELQSKLRSSTHLNQDSDSAEDLDHHHHSSRIERRSEDDSKHVYEHSRSSTVTLENNSTEEVDTCSDSAIPLFEIKPDKNDAAAFDFKQRRKSYGFESFDTRSSYRSRPEEHIITTTTSEFPVNTSSGANHQRNVVNLGIDSKQDSSTDDPPYKEQTLSSLDALSSLRRTGNLINETNPGIQSAGVVSRSWDLIQSAHSSQQKREANKKFFSSSSPNNNGSYHPIVSAADRTAGLSIPESSTDSSHQKSILKTMNEESDHNDKTLLLESRISRFANSSSFAESKSDSRTKTFLNSSIVDQDVEALPSIQTPDVLHHNANPSILSPSLERSRKLLKMLNEAPDLLHKMSYKNYFSKGEKEATWSDEKDESVDWETQRQLSFLNDSLSRILDEGRGKDGSSNSNLERTTTTGGIRTTSETSSDRFREELNIYNLDENIDFTHSRNEDSEQIDNSGIVKAGALGQVSHTWISSGDAQKPSQKVRDNDVITSIAATNDPFKKGPKKVEFCKTEVHFTADSGRFHIVETDENKPSTSHLFRKKKKGDKKKSHSSSHENVSVSSEQEHLIKRMSTSSQSDKCSDKSSEVIINGVGVESFHLEKQESAAAMREELLKKQEEAILHKIHPLSSDSSSSASKPFSLLVKSDSFVSSSRGESRSSTIPAFLPILSLHKETDGAGDIALERSHIVMNVEGREGIPSPSHNILSNYGEMKIQRYLKQLKSPSSLQSESPSELDDFVVDPDQDYPSHFRFDNVLYENGSFVPLATRRSLIEMNNRNRKRNNVSQLSTNSSSTMSNYFLPNSDKENSANEYQPKPFRLTRMEAKVETNPSKPQITHVELRYERDMNDTSENSVTLKAFPQPKSYADFRRKHSLGGGDSNSYGMSSGLPAFVKPSDSSVFDRPKSSSSNNYSSRPTATASSHNKTHDRYSEGHGMLREESVYHNPMQVNESHSKIANRLNDYAISTDRTASNSSNKVKSKSIVTIGEYTESSSSHNQYQDYPHNNNAPDYPGISPEPVLSMDHTWKGPAHFETEGSPTPQSTSPTMKSLTLQNKSSSSSEPEWVYKARSRELRVTDWDLVGKQSASSPNQTRSEPPWMDEIMRVRNRSSVTEEVKAMPKISVVYPWQRKDSDERSRSDQEDDRGPELDEIEEKSHIVSLVPPLPPRKDASSDNYSSVVDSSKGKFQEISVIQISKSDVESKNSSNVIHSTASSRRKHKNYSRENNEEMIRSPTLQDSESNKYSSSLISNMVDRQNNSSNTKTTPTGISSSSNKTVKNNSSKVSEVSSSFSTHQGKSVMAKSSSVTNHSNNNTNDQASMKRNLNNIKKIPSLKKVETEGYELAGRNNLTNSSHPTNNNNNSLSNTIQRENKRGRIVSHHMKRSDMEETSGSSRTNTPVVHQHPTVKVSKLPIRNKPPVAVKTPTEAKQLASNNTGSRVKSREKHHGQYKLGGDKLSVSCRLF